MAESTPPGPAWHTPVVERLAVALLVAVLALTVGPVATFATGNAGKVDNVAATREYLLARHSLALTFERAQQDGGEAVQSLVAQVKNDCPDLLASAPANHARDDVRAEIGAGVFLTLERPERSATISFAKKVERLRWSNRKLTYYVSHSAREEVAKEELALPDICVDARAFAADGFTAAPATTERFLRSYDAANSITTITGPGDLEEIISRLLKPYERPDEKALIPHKPTKREIEQALTILETDAGKPIVEIAHALGLPE
jgi:hypothetical protein